MKLHCWLGHAWDGCHCLRCGEICSHPETTDLLDSAQDPDTFHGTLTAVCKRCGQSLGQTWRK